MKIRRRESAKPRIEIIPMIDVIFFLLVFFMVSSLAMTKINSIQVDLPKTAKNPEALRQKVILSIRRDGALFLRDNTSCPNKYRSSQLRYSERDTIHHFTGGKGHRRPPPPCNWITEITALPSNLIGL